jgi:hypothetical protein
VRSLNNLKEKLYSSKFVIDGRYMTVNDYLAIKKMVFRNKIDSIDDDMIAGILTPGGDTVDLTKFGEIIGLFNYYPI